MADWNGIMSKRGVGVYEDFEEEEVWSVVKQEREDSSSSPNMWKSPSASAWRVTTTATTSPRMIPKATPTIPSTTTAQGAKVASAPVNIPDWSKIYGKRNSTLVDDDHGSSQGKYDDEDYDDECDDMVPPHEWIARKLARSQISSSSVCEGIGRTLKGRDLSKVRNAILTKTGFLE